MWARGGTTTRYFVAAAWLMSLDVKGQKILFSYGRAASDGAVFRLSGGVRFALDGTQIAANEADVDTRAGTISLSGDVTIKIIR